MFYENVIALSVHGGGSHGGLPQLMEQALIFFESIAGKSPTEIFNIVMPGLSAMMNIHPLLVHFPIAFLLSFVCIDFAGSLFGLQSWRKFAGGFLYLGTIMASFTVYAGLEAAKTVTHNDLIHEIMERHEHLAISVLSVAALLSLWRLLSRGMVRGAANILYQIFAVALGVLLSLTADLGGFMVYKHGVAVAPMSAQITMQAGDHVHDQGQDQDVTQDHDHGHDHDHQHSH